MNAVSISSQGPVRHLELNNPDTGNRLNVENLISLAAAIATAPSSAERFILIDGKGPDFCLGREPGPLPTGPSPTQAIVERVAQPILSVYSAIRSSALPVVASVRGRAFGLGCALAGTCDVTLATADARFSLPELDKNLPPTLAITGLIGRVNAKAIGELVLSRREIDAHEACRLGIVSRVLPGEAELKSAVDELGRSFSANKLRALTTVKRFLAMTAYAAQPANADAAAETLAAALFEMRQ